MIQACETQTNRFDRTVALLRIQCEVGLGCRTYGKDGVGEDNDLPGQPGAGRCDCREQRNAQGRLGYFGLFRMLGL